MKKMAFVGVVATLVLTGCTSPTVVTRIDFGTGVVISTDPTRSTTIASFQTDGKVISCTKPPGDAAQTAKSSSDAELGVKNQAVDGTGQFSNQFESALTLMGGRTTGVVSLRDLQFSLCENARNGFLNATAVAERFKELLVIAEKVVLAEIAKAQALTAVATNQAIQTGGDAAIQLMNKQAEAIPKAVAVAVAADPAAAPAPAAEAAPAAGKPAVPAAAPAAEAPCKESVGGVPCAPAEKK